MTNKIKSPYIVNKWFDLTFFLLTPVLAFLIGFLGEMLRSYLAKGSIYWVDEDFNPIIFFGGILTISHLFLVFFRSHLNKNIFTEFPIRFTLIPLIIFFSIIISPFIYALIGVIITWWDVYHSSLQTFGLGRIYDSKIGNPPLAGRRMDYFLNLFLYAGPILGGVTLIDHIGSDLNEWRVLSEYLFNKTPYFAENTQKFAMIISSLGIIFLIGYAYHYRQLAKNNYKYPKLKLILFASTGLTSIIVWGLNPFGNAFFIMNFFHAIQYYALVYYSEKNNLSSVFKIEKKEWRNTAILAILIIVTLSYGIITDDTGILPSGIYLSAIYYVVSIVHFWYDGFIWSVRKKHV